MAGQDTNDPFSQLASVASSDTNTPSAKESKKSTTAEGNIWDQLSSVAAPPPAFVNPKEKPEPTTKPDRTNTTAAGLEGAVVRGAAPTALGAGLGAVGGMAFENPFAGAKIGAAAVPVGDMFVNSINKIFKTHYVEPSDAVTHMLDKAGVEEPRTQAERIVYQLTKTGAESLGTAKGLGAASQYANNPIVKGVMATMSEKPIEQGVIGAVMGGLQQGVKEAGGGIPAQIAIPLAALTTYGGVKAMIPTAGEALKTIVPATMKAMEGNKPAAQALASAAAPDPSLQKAATDLGLKNLPPEVLTRNPQYQGMAQVVKSVPGSMTGQRQLEALQKVGDRAQKLITDLGGKTDLSQVNEGVRSTMMKTKKDLEDEANNLYSLRDANFDRATATPASNAVKAVRERLELLGGDTKDLSPLERSILDSLAPQQRSGSSLIQHPTYELIDTLRKKAGDAKGRSGPFKDEVSGSAAKYYGLLSEDQAQAMEKAGLSDLAKAARESVKTRKQLEENIVNLFGKEIDKSLVPSLTESVGQLSIGNSANFKKIIESVPPELREQVAVSGLQSAFGKATANGSLNFNTYSKWYEGLLKNKEAYSALTGNLPKDALRQMDNLYMISKNVNNALGKEVRTGLISEAFKAPETMISKIRDFGKRVAVGAVVGAPVAGVGHSLGMASLGNELGAILAAGVAGALGKPKGTALQQADEFLMSQEFADLVKASKSNPRIFSATSSRVANSPSFKKFADAAKIPVAQRAGFFANLLNEDQDPNQKTP